MDPGNWGTDLQGGAQFKYGLLWVVALASLMAIFLQVIAARLGVVTGKDLAQCCRDWYPRWTRWPNWLLCEMAIGACDLAEVLGSAVALNLLFHIPLLWAVIITGLGRAAAAGAAAVRDADDRGGGRWCWWRPSACATSSKFSCCRRRSPAFLEMGRALFRPSLRQAGMIVRRHRHHRRDGHAAQSLSALGPGAEPQAAEGRSLHAQRASGSTRSTRRSR